MKEQPPIQESKSIRVGSDRVTFAGDEVLIEAKHEMHDWEVRDFSVVPVYFEDKKYFLVEKRKAASPYAVRYLLKPWHDELAANTKRFHAYDAATVAERDAAHRSDIFTGAIRVCLLPLYPFLGFLWSGMQERVARFGFVARSLTSISIFTAFCLSFAQGVFAVVMIQGSLRSGRMMIGGFIRAMVGSDEFHWGSATISIVWLDGIILLALMVDVVMRYSHYLREHEWTGGFFEWIIPQSIRKKTA